MKAILIALALAATAVCQPASPRVSQSPSLPADNLPIQKIGPDDLIGISTYDAPELTRTVRVGTDGAIRLPMVKERIHVAGLYPSEVETAISEELVKEEILVDPIVTVSVVESRSRPITVSGAVKSPTTFQASGQVTLLDALARANGLAEDAGPEVLVSKDQPGPDGKPISLTQRIVVKALLGGADPELNLKLTGGEQVRVPDAGRVYVVGNVKKPGAFPLHDAAETSVLKALSLSEGLLPYTGEMAYIYRSEGGAGGKNEIPIDLKKIMDRKSPDVPLLANDILYVTDRSGRRSLAHVMEILGGGIGSAVIYTTTR